MLHIFAGAPVIRNTDKDGDEGDGARKNQGVLWKTLHYDRHEVYPCNSTAADSLQLQYEYDGAPMSDLHSEGGNIGNTDIQDLAADGGDENDHRIANGNESSPINLDADKQPRARTDTWDESCNTPSTSGVHGASSSKNEASVIGERKKVANKSLDATVDYENEFNMDSVRDIPGILEPSSRTITDDLYREVTVHSQCLLVASDQHHSNRSSMTENCQSIEGNYKSDFDSSSSEPSISASCKVSLKTMVRELAPEPHPKRQRRGNGNGQKDKQSDGNKEKENHGNIVDDEWELINETPSEFLQTEVTDTEVVCTCRHSNSNSTDDDRYSCTSSRIRPDTNHSSKVVSLQGVMECVEKAKFDVVVVVLQTSPMKKILLKQGVNVGQYRNVASMMVGDETKFYVDISMWGDHASWVERLSVGDVILLHDVFFYWYRNTISGRATKSSRLYNFHRPQLPYPINWSSIICMKKLQRFCGWLKRTHNFLCSPLIANHPETVVKVFDHLSCEHLNHVQGRIINLSVSDDRSDLYLFLGLRLPKVAVDLQDKKLATRTLFVWGAHHKHIEDLKKNTNKILRLTNILQKIDKDTETYSLHTSEKSEFKFMNLDQEDIEDQICTINYFQFERDSGTKIFLSASNIRECEDLSGLFYTGCTVCATPLLLDSNQVYQRCQECLNGSVGEHFGMFILNVKKSSSSSQQDGSSNEQNCSAQNTSSNMYQILSNSNSFDVLVYPDKACKVFPQFFESKGSGPKVELHNCLRDEMESHLCGKTFNISVQVVQNASDGDSFAPERFILVDMVST